jgi:hypothetical protein
MAAENQESEENLSQEVDELLEQGLSQKEIEQRGYSPSLVRQRVRKRVKTGKGAPGGEVKPGEPRSAATIKRQQYPLEVLIKDLELPVLVDGQAPVFDAGVQYGIRSVLVGVRVAQELSAMGVQQALPIINMAKEMRESEGQAARIIAGELAQATLESNKQILAAIGQQAIAQSPNPMLTMMTQAMQPMFQKAFGGLMGMFTPKPGQPALQPEPQPSQTNQLGEQPAPGPQPQSTQPTPGVAEMSDEEEEEVFG